MTAGRPYHITSTKYQTAVATYDWVALYRDHPYALAAFQRLLNHRFDFTLIDSRTGISDISGLCTAVLPDKLVVLFGPARQNLPILKVARAALEFRRLSDDLRPLIVYPLPSRFDPAMLAGLQIALKSYRDDFTELFRSTYGLPDCDLSAWFRDHVALYIPHYLYQERSVVDADEPNYPGSLRRTYEDFADALVSLPAPWTAT